MGMVNLQIICGDALTELRKLPADSVHCCVTSPPFYGLRDYSVAGQIGLEPSLDEYLARLVAVFEEVKRVLHPSGVCFVDEGDSYARQAGDDATRGFPNTGQARIFMNGLGREGKGNNRPPDGLKPKDRLLVPFRLALLLQSSGWWVRDVICWHKPAPMPESVTDRCTQSWEPILMLTKSARYFWDAEAVKEKAQPQEKIPMLSEDEAATRFGDGTTSSRLRMMARAGTPEGGRNLRNVWSIGPEPFIDSVDGVSHFAAFPSELPKRCILAATSARGVCPKCGEPWVRMVEQGTKCSWHDGKDNLVLGQRQESNDYKGDNFYANYVPPRTIGWRVACDCESGDPIPATVLDPFAGTGTTLAVALELGRNAVGIELNPAYVELARRRCAVVTPGLPLS